MRYPVNFIGITTGHHFGKCLDFGWNSKHGGSTVPIYACDDGKVIIVENHPVGGNSIYIEHNNKMVSAYLHLSKINVKNGQSIQMGQQIGNMGATGTGANGNHLHFGLYSSKSKNVRGESDIDPLKYLEKYKDQTLADGTSKSYGSKILIHNETPKVNANGGLNMRKSNNSTSTILALLSDGTEVTILEEKGDWYKIKIEGFVSKTYIKK